MNQYWMKVKYSVKSMAIWELTRGKFRNEVAARGAYEARAKALDYEILEMKPHEQFEFALKD